MSTARGPETLGGYDAARMREMGHEWVPSAEHPRGGFWRNTRDPDEAAMRASGHRWVESPGHPRGGYWEAPTSQPDVTAVVEQPEAKPKDTSRTPTPKEPYGTEAYGTPEEMMAQGWVWDAARGQWEKPVGGYRGGQPTDRASSNSAPDKGGPTAPKTQEEAQEAMQLFEAYNNAKTAEERQRAYEAMPPAMRQEIDDFADMMNYLPGL